MKQKLLSFVLVFLLTAACLPVCAEGNPSDEQTNDANNLTQTCTVTASENQASVKNLIDGSIKTVWRGNKGTTLTVTCPDPIGSVYIEWDRAPAPFAVSSSDDGQEEESGGDDGFLDEFLSLSDPVQTLTITLNDKAAIDDLYFFGTGDIPSWVQRWQPMLDKADLLVLSAHADDEFLWFGGTIPVYAGEYHKKVQVAYMIHHGFARNEYFRNHELLNALWKAGVTNYPMISNFEDYYTKDLNKELKLLGEDAVMKYTVTLLRRFKPDVVVTHDVNGEYGHGAHKLCAYAVKKAIPLSGDAAVYPDVAEKYGTWTIKKCYLHLYPENPIVMDWNEPLDAFGGKTGLDMAKSCYQCNVSQLKKVYRVAEAGAPYDSRKFGLYYSTVGPDINKNDFFENIAPVMPTPSTTGGTTGAGTGGSTGSISRTTEDQTVAQNPETIASIENTVDDGDMVVGSMLSLDKTPPRSPFKMLRTAAILSGIAAVLAAAAAALILNHRHQYHRKK